MRRALAVTSLAVALIAGLTPAASATDTTTVWSAAAVAQHNLPTDCWTAVSGKVYDLTAFIGTHAGGVADITPMCGVDSTTYFLGSAPSSHSTSYLENLAVLVGVLAPTPSASPSPSATLSPTPSATATKAPSAAPVAKPALRKTTLTCVKGKLVKKVTAVKPKCPTGFKPKR